MLDVVDGILDVVDGILDVVYGTLVDDTFEVYGTLDVVYGSTTITAGFSTTGAVAF